MCFIFVLDPSPHIFIFDFLSALLMTLNGIALKSFKVMNLDTCIRAIPFEILRGAVWRLKIKMWVGGRSGEK